MKTTSYNQNRDVLAPYALLRMLEDSLGAEEHILNTTLERIVGEGIDESSALLEPVLETYREDNTNYIRLKSGREGWDMLRTALFNAVLNLANNYVLPTRLVIYLNDQRIVDTQIAHLEKLLEEHKSSLPAFDGVLDYKHSEFAITSHLAGLYHFKQNMSDTGNRITGEMLAPLKFK